MQFFLLFVSLLYFSQNIVGRRIEKNSIHYDHEISYQDLIKTNVSCLPRDSCTEERRNDISNIPNQYACSCDRECWKFGMCCIDSPFRINDPPIYECTKSHVSDPYYMVHRCPADTDIDSIWKNLCEKEWNGEDDILMLAPVTSLDTSATYRNYYCFKCHEDTDKYVSWNLLLLSNDETGRDGNVDSNIEYSISYNQAREKWMASEVENPIPFTVTFRFEVPLEKPISPILCDTEIVSDCPDTWTDKEVHDKCLAYTAIVYKRCSVYKNPHCAICNNQPLRRISCTPARRCATHGERDFFNFRNLMEINKDKEDKAGKRGKCDNDNLWDPYGKKCRKITCVIPGYVVKNNLCAPP